jgi:uncharacterized protein YjbI with pentapeptide repeats
VPNPEHLAFLYKGIPFWNQWRMEHWNEFLRPDLSKVNLRGLDLSGANFGLVDFTNSDLSNSTLVKAYFLGANLSGAKLTSTKCKGAYFSDAILKETDFREASLFSTDFSRADLTGACLENSYLGAARAIDTNFSSAKLTGACIEDWQINKAHLDGIECKYIYLTHPRRDRCPSNRDFEHGEFTRRFQISQNVLELVFSEGMPWNAFARAFNEINLQVLDEYNSELFLQEYKVLGKGLVILKISYPPKSNGRKIQEDLERKTFELRELELHVAQLKGEIKAKDESLERLERVLSPELYINDIKPIRIHLDDIDTFERIKHVQFDSISHFLSSDGYLNISEDRIQVGLERILSVSIQVLPSGMREGISRGLDEFVVLKANLKNSKAERKH